MCINVPDPGDTVADDGRLAGVIGVAADAFTFYEVADTCAGSKLAINWRSPGPGPVATVVERVWVKTASLTSRVQPRPTARSPSRPAAFFTFTACLSGH